MVETVDVRAAYMYDWVYGSHARLIRYSRLGTHDVKYRKERQRDNIRMLVVSDPVALWC